MSVSTDYTKGYIAGFGDGKAGRHQLYTSTAPAATATPAAAPVQSPAVAATAPAPAVAAPVVDATPAGVVAATGQVAANPAPAIITVKPTDNIQTIVAALKGGEALQLVPGGNYTWQGPVAWKVPNVSFNFSGATITFTMKPNWNMCFQVQGAGTKLYSGTFKVAANTQYCLFRVYADGVTISGNKIGNGFCNALITDHGGTNCSFVSNVVGLTNSCSVFLTQDGGTLNGNVFAGSIGEATLRIDRILTTDPNGANISIIGNAIRSVAGSNLKGICEWRQAGAGCSFTSNFCYDYVRIGQDYQTTTNGSIGNVAVSNNTWMQLPPTSVNEHLMLKNGTVTVVGNIFPVNASTQVAYGSGHVDVTFSKNTLKLTASGVKPKPSIIEADATCTVHDDNTATIIPFTA